MKLLALFFCFASVLLKAQTQFYVAAETTYGTYAMRQMKDLQDQFKANSTTIALKSVASFPGYFGYGASVGLTINKRMAVGWGVNYNSTGGRLDYEDYSGLARVDQMLTSYSFKSFFRSQINASEKWPLFISISPSRTRTRFDLKSQLTVGNQTDTQKESFRSVNYGLLPAVVLQRNIWPTIFLQASVGFELQLLGKLYFTTNNKYYLQDQQGSPIKADWSGLRVGLGAGIMLGNNRHTKEEPTK